MQKFKQACILPFSPQSVFDWHERSGAFERLNPPWETVKVLSHTGGIKDGAKVTIRIPIGPFGMLWELEHRNYIYSKQFQDVQLKGPFASWEHTHKFKSHETNCCLLEDYIEYALPSATDSNTLIQNLCKKKLARLFRYRHRATLEDLLRHDQFKKEPKLRIGITGASGFIGKELSAFLSGGGHTVIPLIRENCKSANNSTSDECLKWNPSTPFSLPSDTYLDAVIHLAGEEVVGRWSEEKMEKIRESRSLGTRYLCQALANLPSPPKVLISGSAIGIYGNRGDELLSENSSPGQGFLADVAQDWETASQVASDRGIRVVNLRIGLVLSPKGKALKTMLPAFRLGIAGKLGTGDQYMSWITLEDLIYLVHFCLFTEDIVGSVNGVAPNPVQNREFTKTLGKVLRRPTILPVPKFVLNLLFGEFANQTLLASTRVTPKIATQKGFNFSHPELESALQYQLGY